ncbi:cytochrome P450 [Kitasatospora sp. NPDC048540]|uniref:cytochrome P450 n=1 Tax=Kitasatospora sp. NPDC048540 TaxID=3155634 RepID=UPI00340C6D67
MTAVPAPAGDRAARQKDRLVYLRSHPVLFALLSATRGRPVVRLGRTVLVHGPDAYREVLTSLPLDRTADGTTGGAAARLSGGGLLFDQDGAGHRAARRPLAARLGRQGVERLRPVWQEVLERRLAVLDGPVDLVPVVRELAGASAAVLTGSDADPLVLARAAAGAASAAAGEHLPGLLPRRRGHGAAAAARLAALLPDPLDAMVAVAAVNTTVAALPRAAAWCARAGLWPRVSPELAVELLRLTAASPVLPRVAAADGVVAGCPVRRGDRLVLVARHAAEAHRAVPERPAAAAQAVFGAGPHACPGAALARTQLADFLAALAPHRPRVLRARVDRRSALPGYAVLLVGRG